MQIDSGTFGTGTTGSATWLMNKNFTPKLILFFASGKTSGDTEPHLAIGYWHDDGSGAGSLDGTVQEANGKASETRSVTFAHYAGSVKKLEFTVTGVASGQFTLNHTVVTSQYNIHWLALA